MYKGIDYTCLIEVLARFLVRTCAEDAPVLELPKRPKQRRKKAA